MKYTLDKIERGAENGNGSEESAVTSNSVSVQVKFTVSGTFQTVLIKTFLIFLV